MMVHPLANEAELLHALRAGDESAFTQLYLYYSPGLYTAILSMAKDPEAAQEIVQEIFSLIWKNRKESADISNFAGYLVKAGQNRIFNFFKKLQLDKEKLQQFRLYATAHYSHIEEALHYQESSAMLEAALDKLTPQQARVYRLCRIDGFTNREAAEQLGISVYTVKEYLKEANKKVRSYFDNNPEQVLILLILIHLGRL
ncbi:RNA polymerase sigma factor [Chitinophaga sp. Cy-1792]|uniref:RNA polymerase sigma factor n=1 Tax=Chitinophaga sp. Cy-1792 TaxID=2608339 RepID=UPI001420C2AC|nr:sigma-70 family RNA polymerase sigma factor [Chitinophaga sp. Cy-1792]NIG53583.1 sigma-70 family RNA polymerase sigma factor [Chitinophaga sp. Cy-1792]